MNVRESRATPGWRGLWRLESMIHNSTGELQCENKRNIGELHYTPFFVFNAALWRSSSGQAHTSDAHTRR